MINSVLIIHRHLIYGGAEKYTINLANSLVKRGVRVTLIAGDGPLAEHISPKVNLFLMPISRKPKIKRITERKILEIAKAFKPDIIHTQNRTSLVNAQLARKTLNIPLVTHEHHMYLPKDYPYIVNELIESSDKIITCGPYASKELIKNGVDKDNIITILGGIDVRSVKPIGNIERSIARMQLRLKDTDKVVVCLSRLEPGKGIDKLTLGFIKVAKKIPNSKLLIIGDDLTGLVKPFVKKIAEENNLRDRILMYKGTYDIRQFHAVADVFCYPALVKGMSVMEAMAAGLPVVGKGTNRKPYVVKNNVSGLMTKKTKKFPINPSSIAKNLIYLLNRTDLAKKMGKEGRKRIEKTFYLEKVVNNVLLSYDETIEYHSKLPRHESSLLNPDTSQYSFYKLED